LFGEKPDPLFDRAATLVQAAKTNAVPMLIPLLDRFPILRQVDTEHWDFVLTVAGVSMAATRLNYLRLGDAREKKLVEVVTEHLNEWNADGIRGFEDCKGLFETQFDSRKFAGDELWQRLVRAEQVSRFSVSDALGTWIVWNLLGRAPKTEEECRLVRETGILATHPFSNWWDK
jgi:hypothetical protein